MVSVAPGRIKAPGRTGARKLRPGDGQPKRPKRLSIRRETINTSWTRLSTTGRKFRRCLPLRAGGLGIAHCQIISVLAPHEVCRNMDFIPPSPAPTAMRTGRDVRQQRQQHHKQQKVPSFHRLSIHNNIHKLAYRFIINYLSVC